MQIDKRADGSQPVVLIADDDSLCLDVGMKMLQKLGCSVLEARDGKEAIQVYTKNHAEIDLVILDMKMPYNGADTFEKLKELNSEVRVLVATGCTEDQGINQMKAQGCFGCIQKPYSIKLLSEQITSALSD